MIPDALAKRNHFQVFKFHGKGRGTPGDVFPALFLASCLRLTPRCLPFLLRSAFASGRKTPCANRTRVSDIVPIGNRDGILLSDAVVSEALTLSVQS